jgi:CO/xanthine dehydrogenase Mo-binding subunit
VLVGRCACQIQLNYLLNQLPLTAIARGIGEIGLAGMAPAIYHATGVLVRDLPVRVEDLITATVAI